MPLEDQKKKISNRGSQTGLTPQIFREKIGQRSFLEIRPFWGCLELFRADWDQILRTSQGRAKIAPEGWRFLGQAPVCWAPVYCWYLDNDMGPKFYDISCFWSGPFREFPCRFSLKGCTPRGSCNKTRLLEGFFGKLWTGSVQTGSEWNSHFSIKLRFLALPGECERKAKNHEEKWERKSEEKNKKKTRKKENISDPIYTNPIKNLPSS